MIPNPVILREYDIRGTFGKTLFESDALWLGQRFGTLLLSKGGKVATVCRDGRHSSPILQKALIEGLISTGVQVIDIGIGPTPMSYFSGHYLQADATLMITGSHNPPEDNGIKITLNNRPFFSKDIQNLLRQNFMPKAGGGCTDKSTAVFKAYVERINQAHSFQKKLKIAWDAGNGAAGPVIEALTKLLPQHEHILMFTDIDSNFPNHHPDPSVPSNLDMLKESMLQKDCDIGFAFDGDGDRVGVVDKKGRILHGDQLATILASEILSQVPGATIIADVKCSNTLFQSIEELGGHPIMGKTGHSWIKEEMRAEDAAFAGEMSGHMFFAHNYYGFDDGIYAAMFTLNIAQKALNGFSSLVDALPHQFSTPEYRIDCMEEDKIKIIDSIKQHLVSKNRNFLSIDGVRVECGTGWWLLRASNTQSVLIARAEADSEQNLEIILNEIKSLGISLPTV